MSSAAITINNLIFSKNVKNDVNYDTEKVANENNYQKEGAAFNNDIDFVTSVIKEEKNKLSSIERKLNCKILLDQIDCIKAIGNDWSEEQIKGPNDFAVGFSIDLAKQLIKNDLVPLRITQSIEEGICFVFKKDQKYLYLEIYNDSELGIIVEDYNKKIIIKNKEVIHQQEIIEDIIEFMNYV